MNLTIESLIAGGVAPTQARQVFTSALSACARFEMSTAARAGAFLAQCWVESAGFVEFEENCYWSSPERICKFFPSSVQTLEQAQKLARNPPALANTVYANKNGNGSAQSGDGWKFRGRGCIQLTGRSNYHDCAVEMDRPYVEHPDLVGQMPDAMLTAGWFWHSRKLNLLADSAQWDSITRAINGSKMDQASLRKQRSEEMIRALQ